MLLHRLLMSAILIPTTIILFLWDHQLGEKAPLFFVLVMLLATRCVWELVTLGRVAGLRPSFAISLAGTWSMILLAWGPHVEHGWGSRFYGQTVGVGLLLFGAVGVLLFVNAVYRFPRHDSVNSGDGVISGSAGREIATLGLEFVIVVYVGVFLALTAQLRWPAEYGYFALGALVVAAKCGDIGAYTFGRLIGGPKMTPKLSPGKTWAGGVGHLLTASLCTTLWLCWLGPKFSDSWRARDIWGAATFGVVVGFAGLLGDLAESMIKRDVGVKDAPALLPGFGGLLDLMDSILLAGPVAFGMWIWLGR